MILLRRDAIARDVETLDPETALRHVEEGRDHHGHSTPFLNPHLLVKNLERTELQRRYFRRLFTSANVTALNVERLSVKEANKAVLSALGL